MGLFRRKSKNIVLKQDISGYLVFPYLFKRDIVPLGRTVDVPEGTCFVLAMRGKILDILPEGQHLLAPVNLPLANKKFKLSKMNKYGELPDGFQGYGYYVNKGVVQSFPFETYKKLKYENPLDGKFWVKMEFAIDFAVVDEALLLKKLFRARAYLRPNEAEDIFATWLSEFVTNTLQKYAFRQSEFALPRVVEMTELLGGRLDVVLRNLGAELYSITLLNVEMKGEKRASKNPLMDEPCVVLIDGGADSAVNGARHKDEAGGQWTDASGNLLREDEIEEDIEAYEGAGADIENNEENELPEGQRGRPRGRWAGADIENNEENELPEGHFLNQKRDKQTGPTYGDWETGGNSLSENDCNGDFEWDDEFEDFGDDFSDEDEILSASNQFSDFSANNGKNRQENQLQSGRGENITPSGGKKMRADMDAERIEAEANWEEIEAESLRVEEEACLKNPQPDSVWASAPRSKKKQLESQPKEKKRGFWKGWEPGSPGGQCADAAKKPDEKKRGLWKGWEKFFDNER